MNPTISTVEYANILLLYFFSTQLLLEDAYSASGDNTNHKICPHHKKNIVFLLWFLKQSKHTKVRGREHIHVSDTIEIRLAICFRPTYV